MRLIAAVFALLIAAVPAAAQTSPNLFTQNGEFAGNLNRNRFDPNSIHNPYGRYGSQFSPDSMNNRFGRYGNDFSPDSPSNRFGPGLQVHAPDGRYLGSLSASPLSRKYRPDRYELQEQTTSRDESPPEQNTYSPAQRPRTYEQNSAPPQEPEKKPLYGYRYPTYADIFPEVYGPPTREPHDYRQLPESYGRDRRVREKAATNPAPHAYSYMWDVPPVEYQTPEPAPNPYSYMPDISGDLKSTHDK